jgi:hypothetical protein
MNRQIARDLNTWAAAKLHEKAQTDDLPILTEDDQMEGIQQILAKHNMKEDPHAKALGALTKGVSIEYVSVQIADLVISRLSMLDKMEERSAAMRQAIEIVRNQGVLPVLKTTHVSHSEASNA